MLTTSVMAPGIAPLVILRLFTRFVDTQLKSNEVLGQADWQTRICSKWSALMFDLNVTSLNLFNFSIFEGSKAKIKVNSHQGGLEIWDESYFWNQRHSFMSSTLNNCMKKREIKPLQSTEQITLFIKASWINEFCQDRLNDTEANEVLAWAEGKVEDLVRDMIREF